MTIISVNKLSYASCENIAEYWSKYYALKAKITEQNIKIKDSLKIRMLTNLGPAFKTYLTIFNDRIGKDANQDDNKTIFKAVQKEKTGMKAA